jgi:DNA-binding transcriptional LysR family regulator
VRPLSVLACAESGSSFRKIETAQTLLDWRVDLAFQGFDGALLNFPRNDNFQLEMHSKTSLDDGVTIPPIQFVERGVQGVHAPIVERLKLLRWDDIKLISAFEEHPSLRQAARSLGCSVNTVRARLDRMEETLQHPLFFRGASGLRLTAEGEITARLAKRMQHVSDTAGYVVSDSDIEPNTSVRIACSEGLAGFWLTQRLSKLHRRLPHCPIELSAEPDRSRIHDRQNDLSIAFERPKDMHCIAARVATIHMMLYCSRTYASRYGIPQTIDDLGDHAFIEQSGTSLHPGIAAIICGERLAKRQTLLTVNSSLSAYMAIASGLGIGALPTYASALSKRIMPITLPISLRFDVWLSYDPIMKNRLVTRQCVDWLRECFDPVSFPWFSERFVHPDDFETPFFNSQDLPLFDQLIEGID